MTPAPYPSSRGTLCSTWCCTCSGGSETDTERAAVLIQRSPAEARLFLERLVEAGPAEAHGRTKTRTYHLAAATYRRLGDKAAYVHRRGFEPIQQEQMILQYIESHGAITRGEAAELCHLTADQAYRTLQRLVAKGQLRQEGEKKGARYVRSR